MNENKVSSNFSSIQCFSRKSERTVENGVLKEIEKIIAKNITWNDDEKATYFNRFREVYESALHENIKVDDKPWLEDDDEETTVLEPVNVQCREYMNKELVPELDNALVTVAKQRKHYPYLCAQALAKQCKHQCSFQNKVVAAPVFERVELQPAEGQGDGEHAGLREALTASVHLVKTIPSLVVTAGEVEAASDALQTQCDSRTDAVIFTPDKPKSSSEAPPLGRRLEFPEEPPVKRARSSPRLAMRGQAKGGVRRLQRTGRRGSHNPNGT